MSLISLTVNSDWSRRSKILRRISSEMAPKSSMFGMMGSRFWLKFEFITLPANTFLCLRLRRSPLILEVPCEYKFLKKGCICFLKKMPF